MSASRPPRLQTRAARNRVLALPIETEHLRLREFRHEDFEALCRYVTDPRVTRFLFSAPDNLDEARRYLSAVIGHQQERPRGVWELAVDQLRGGRHIGACNLTVTSPGEGDIGYMLHTDTWGKGFASEIACALRDAAFRDLGMERVIATVDVRNAASIRVLEKAGLRWEATYRKLRRARGQWRDCHLFTLARIVWQDTLARR
jgi:[ribosomal protein S5]-alanine N-acetyltransferase